MGFCTACIFVILAGAVVLKLNPRTDVSSTDIANIPPATDGILISNDSIHIEDAATFLASRLDPIFHASAGNRELLWQVFDTSFAEKWTWCESSVDMISPNLSVPPQTTCYDLSPSDLDLRSSIEPTLLHGEQLWALRLECQTMDCISFNPPIGIGSENHPSQYISESDSHRWFYTSRANAERSSIALAQLLHAAGSSEGPF